jgi:CubicO group peptidase (beta-lactamase class C family)
MTSLSDQTCTDLHRIVAAKQSTFRIPGVAAGIGRDGALVWSDGVGASDISRPDEAPTDDTQFLIASHTKTFTAVLVMQLRDEGKLSLDDSVEKHIPESKHGGMTIRQMLSHVTGMQREPIGDVWDTLIHPDRAELIEGWNAAERILKPHFKWHYSNLVYSMLGEIVARIDGREWSESLQARLLDPLELRRTTVGLADNTAVGYYVPPFSDVPVVEPVLETKAMDPAGALASTVRDMVAWGAFLADPVAEVLSPDTLEEMCQPQIMADLDKWRLAWGLGFMLLRSGDRVWIGHTGGMPGHITGLVVQRQTKTVSTVLMNSTAAPDPAAFAIELGESFIDAEPVTAQTWRPGTELPSELVGVLGRWFSEGRPFTFSIHDGRLEARIDGAPDWMPPSVFEELGDDLYRTTSGRETGELLRITRDDAGNVSRLNWATYRFTREPYAFGEWL